MKATHSRPQCSTTTTQTANKYTCSCKRGLKEHGTDFGPFRKMIPTPATTIRPRDPPSVPKTLKEDQDTEGGPDIAEQPRRSRRGKPT
eukprot:2951402-Rhodomonas_salina.2